MAENTSWKIFLLWHDMIQKIEKLCFSTTKKKLRQMGENMANVNLFNSIGSNSIPISFSFINFAVQVYFHIFCTGGTLFKEWFFNAMERRF